MNPSSKKFISLFLIFSLLSLSINIYAKEKRGAILIITKKYGGLIEGELIAVKKDSLLLFTGRDVSIDIEDIKVIRIVKKSKFGKGLLYGLLIGVVGGGLFGLAFGDRDFFRTELGKAAFLGDVAFAGIYFGAIGLLVGGTLGFASGIDKTIQIEGLMDSEIRRTLDYLRKKARVRDYK